MDVDYVAQAKRQSIRDAWLRETWPKLRRSRVFELLAEEACKSLGYGDLSCDVVDVERGSFNLVHFVQFEATQSRLDKMPAGGNWVVKVMFPDMPLQLERFQSELVTMQWVFQHARMHTLI